MTQKIVECIPNFSEGRRKEVIESIATSIEAVDGAFVLDRHSDPDHNRTVITFVGAPGAAQEAAFHAIRTAAEKIDLDLHSGEHPRIGATDVVPFVPIEGVDMAECVELARSLGERVARELSIPVYLYEQAATRPDRVNLANIRRGEYEGLKKSIETDPERAPDFGPSRLGKAGATVIGARQALIAFNVYLTSSDVEIAKSIARAVRHSSGGLHYVKALGLLVERQAQVSMNLTDYTRTPVARVVEMIRREAQRYGVTIDRSELVGLIPQAALIDAARWHLQLDDFEPDQILEMRLGAALRRQPTFLDRLASATATPGGGAAAAQAGAMAAALVAMVARLTQEKKAYEPVAERMREIAGSADDLRRDLEADVERDINAFDEVMRAYRLPKGTPDQERDRAQAIEDATHGAALVPLQVAEATATTLELSAEVAETGNVNAISDAGSAGALARAALQAASLNVRANAASVKDKAAAQGWLDQLEILLNRAAEAHGRLNDAIRQRGAL